MKCQPGEIRGGKRAVLRGFADVVPAAWVRADGNGRVSAPILSNVSVWIFLASPGEKVLLCKKQLSPQIRAAFPVLTTK